MHGVGGGDENLLSGQGLKSFVCFIPELEGKGLDGQLDWVLDTAAQGRGSW